MKKIEAYIQPFMLQHVLHALREAHVHGLTVSDVRGFGREKDESYPHGPADYAVDFTPKTKLEILCKDADAHALVETLRTAAHTGRRGDGKVSMLDVGMVVSIRSGDTGDAAI